MEINMSRIETGPVKFGEDWTGIFIRGDNAMYYSMLLLNLINELELINKSKSIDDQNVDLIHLLTLKGFANLLGSINENESYNRDIQKLKEYEQCLDKKMI
jgi:hypothetical protein